MIILKSGSNSAGNSLEYGTFLTVRRNFPYRKGKQGKEKTQLATACICLILMWPEQVGIYYWFSPRFLLKEKLALFGHQAWHSSVHVKESLKSNV